MGIQWLSTDACYEGFNELEDCHTTDTYAALYENPEIDNGTIEFADWAWSEAKYSLQERLSEAIAAYEEQYRTSIVKVAIAGTMGLWNGSPTGGRFLSVDDNPMAFMGNVDEVEVKLDTDGTVNILGHHHDGTHRMQVYLLTEKVFDKIEDLDYEAFEWIVENRTPVKFKKLAKALLN